MDHLSTEELTRWLARGDAAERERIEGHLSICDDCGRLYREILKSAPAGGASRLAPGGFVERGREMGPRSRGSIRNWHWAAGAAACLVLAVLSAALYRSRGGEAVILRGSDLEAASPRGEVGAPFEFSWEPGGSRVVLEVFDAERRRIFSTVAEGGSIPLPEELALRLQSGRRYFWMVTRLDARGERTASSALLEFVPVKIR